tara:strand:+ start:95 stop:1210 length:1116 start_codon:yes stop_codon:yes gene_type:complete
MLDIKKNKDEFQDLKVRYNEIKSAFNYDFFISKLSDLKKQSIEEGFWDNRDNAQKILKEINNIENQIEKWNNLANNFEELSIFLDLSMEDSNLSSDFEESIVKVRSMLDEMELINLLKSPEDKKNAIITIHAGAGGTDAQDWASMLYRMYARWCDMNSYSISILSLQEGDEAGIKEVSLEVKGLYAYGYLKSEIGIHRLVRISPFNSNAKRHTSFASVFVSPILDDDIVVDINDKDLKIDTYRASGAGGQHVNKTDSAVRIKHIPTEIVVQCQNQRSQLNNKNNAIKMLKSKLYQLELDKLEEQKNKMSSGKKTISWGSQIRSYVFHPYNMVKDHRTKCETSNLNNVMDGDLEVFIRAYLLYQMEINNDRK